jgi:hypothetical protein
MWTYVKYGDHTYKVPATGPKENLEAMLTEIPGQDDVVTPLALHDQRFYRWCMAFLLQDGDLDVPGGRYGTSTRTCAEVAIALSLIMQYHNGESVTYHQLNSDMGAVVNSNDGVAETIREWAGIVGLDAEDYLSEEDLADDAVDRLAAHLGYGEVREYHDGKVFVLTDHFAEQLLAELTDKV